MLKKVLSTIDIYTDTVHTIKLPLDEYRVRLLEGFVLKKRLSNNPKDYSYEDYVIPHFKSLNFLNDYICDFFYDYHHILKPIRMNLGIHRHHKYKYSRGTYLNLQDLFDYGYANVP